MAFSIQKLHLRIPAWFACLGTGPQIMGKRAFIPPLRSTNDPGTRKWRTGRRAIRRQAEFARITQFLALLCRAHISFKKSYRQ
jgi:hypothetical protein